MRIWDCGVRIGDWIDGVDVIDGRWWNGRMKKTEEIRMLRERVAVLESRLAGVEEQLQCVRAKGNQTDRMVMTAYERTTELLRLGWEVLRTVRPDFRRPGPGGDLGQEHQCNQSAGRGKAADG